MTNSIQDQQNNYKNQLLLAAQRQLYSEAKSIMNWRLLFTLFFLTLPVLLYYFPNVPDLEYFGWLILFVFLAITDFFLKPSTKKKTEQAAKIQEQFDIKVLSIPDSPLPFSAFMDSTTVYEKAKKHIKKLGIGELPAGANNQEQFFKNNEVNWKAKSGLIDWYAIPSNLTQKQAALFAQKSNLLWDKDQRKIYAKVFLWLMIVVIVLIFLWGHFQELSSDDLVAKIIPLVLPFIQLLFENYQTHREVSNEQEQRALNLNEVLLKKQPVDNSLLRLTQDAIYQNRTKMAFVPDIVYKILKNRKFEQRMQDDALNQN